MRTELFWIEGPWPGRLAIMPRPRGGDWLEEEIQAWRQAGIDIIVSLLTPDEYAELNLVEEGNLCRTNGIEFMSFPIIDRTVPTSMDEFFGLATALVGKLANGKNVAVHCRQGIGRAGLLAICLLISSGIEPSALTHREGSFGTWLCRSRNARSTTVDLRFRESPRGPAFQVTGRDAMMVRTPLILLSGMAADGSLFTPQREAFPHLIAPAWIDALPQESLRAYAARLAGTLDPGRPCIVGGASFGGIVALEMATHLQATACVLISSVRSPLEMPWWYRLFRPAALMSPSRLGWAAGHAAEISSPSLPRSTVRRLQHLSRPRAEFLRWATWAVLRWQPSPGVQNVRVLQIHGNADRTFPIRFTRPDVVVAGGGHLLTLTHPKIVNEFLHRAVLLCNPASAVISWPAAAQSDPR